MSEALNDKSDFSPSGSLHEQLVDLRGVLETKERVAEHIAITTDVNLFDELSLKVCIGARDFEGTNGSIFIRLGEDLSDPALHDWIAAEDNGEVFRYDSQKKAFYPIETPEDIEMLSLVVTEIKQQYNDIPA